MCSHLSWYIQVQGKSAPAWKRNKKFSAQCGLSTTTCRGPWPPDLGLFLRCQSLTAEQGHFPQRRRHGIALSCTLGAVALALPAPWLPGRRLDQGQNSLSAQDANHVFNRESLHPTGTFSKNSVSLVHYNCTDLRVISYLLHRLGLPMGGAVVKNLPANAGVTGDAGLIPGSGTYLGVGKDNPLNHFGLGNPMDRGGWWAPWGLTEPDTTEWLSMHTHMTQNTGFPEHSYLHGEKSELLFKKRHGVPFGLEYDKKQKKTWGLYVHNWCLRSTVLSGLCKGLLTEWKVSVSGFPSLQRRQPSLCSGYVERKAREGSSRKWPSTGWTPLFWEGAAAVLLAPELFLTSKCRH